MSSPYTDSETADLSTSSSDVGMKLPTSDTLCSPDYNLTPGLELIYDEDGLSVCAARTKVSPSWSTSKHQSVIRSVRESLDDIPDMMLPSPLTNEPPCRLNYCYGGAISDDPCILGSEYKARYKQDEVKMPTEPARKRKAQVSRSTFCLEIPDYRFAKKYCRDNAEKSRSRCDCAPQPSGSR
jgi:hypothetical protein